MIISWFLSKNPAQLVKDSLESPDDISCRGRWCWWWRPAVPGRSCGSSLFPGTQLFHLLLCIIILNNRPHLLVFALPQQQPILSSQQLPHHHNGHHQQASHLHLGHHYLSKNHLFWFLTPRSSRRLATSSIFLCQAKQPKSLAEQVMADKVDSAKKEKGGRDNSEEQAKTEMPRSIESIEIFF